ncbi:MAG: hypothetical protein KJ550_03850 [Proteobacteria bacterium]|nr:hypothetical protein [Pseudomonadota bacterium]MBU4068302.1 hypothetical protein [Pseudomonadota bacterium]
MKAKYLNNIMERNASKLPCLNNIKPQMQLSFVPYGSILRPEPGKLALDVGNRLCPGIVDHHQPNSEKECATSLVLRYPNYIIDHLKGYTLDAVTFVTHIMPDLDAVTSVYFSYALLTKGHFPSYAENIAHYVRDIDMGIFFSHSGRIVSVYSIFIGICELIRSEAEKNNWPEDRIYKKRVKCGFALWEYVISEMDNNTDLHDFSTFDLPNPFQDAIELLRNDYLIYLEDLKKSREIQNAIPYKDKKKSHVVDSIIIKNPKSLLFRFWARSDYSKSSRGKGFIMLAVNYDDNRYIISVDPRSPFYLKGLGDMLEEAETEKRKLLSKERQGEIRSGYSSPDPWYDGRNSLHNFTIIDTPRGGTVLTQHEIQMVIDKYCSINSSNL